MLHVVAKFTMAALCCLVVNSDLFSQTYFQQSIDYRISVSLDDVAHRLDASIEMDYSNNSPEALDTLYMHLWPNAYESRNTELGRQLRESGDFSLEFSKEQERGYIEIESFNVGSESLKPIVYKGNLDICYLLLSEPIQPGETRTITADFAVKIPVGRFSRLGHIDQSYQITQWYPKPAVYDAQGWHPITYLSRGEFYSEYGTFEVDITLPSNYIVAATGQQMDPVQRERLLERAEKTKSGAWKERNDDFPPSLPETYTWKFTQDNVHDFAWFADKRFNVLHQAFTLDGSGKEVDGWVYFTNKHVESWSKSMEYVVDATRHYSSAVGDYPYSQVSVVDGTLSAGGGMEYPMITVINGTSNDLALEQVIVHEIGHNWFYGILGTNEREHAWMDEGINSYYEGRYFAEKYKKKDGEFNLASLNSARSDMQELAYRYSACRHQDQALSISSDDFSPINYGTMVYLKGAKAMDHLHGVLGAVEFDKAMKAYYQDWSFRHPAPKDMQASLEASTGQDLNWFFEDVIARNAKVDHRISYSPKEKGAHVYCKTSYSGPVPVGFLNEGKLVDLQIAAGDGALIQSDRVYDRVEIDPERRTLELDRSNDETRTSGILKTWQSPRLKPVISLGMNNRPSIYYAPAVGFNNQDRWMLGAYLSNAELLFKDFEWTILPLYGTESRQLVGMAGIRKTFWMSEEGPARIDLAFKARRFSLDPTYGDTPIYNDFAPSLSYTYEDASKKKGKHTASLEADFIQYEAKGPLTVFVGNRQVYYRLNYEFTQRKGLSRFAVNVNTELHESYQKITASASINHILNEKEDRISLRWYGGVMSEDNFIPLGARLNLSGTTGAPEIDGSADDYRYDYLFFDRGFEPGKLGRQMVRDRGGFVQGTSFGVSTEWLTALNLEVDLPLGPISLYGNLGFYDTGLSVESLYETGARVTVLRDKVDVSFPLFVDKTITDSNDFRDVKYAETIRIQLRIELAELRSIIDGIEL